MSRLLVITLLLAISTACTEGKVAPLGSVGSAAPRPAYCVEAEQGTLQAITGTPASPYFLHHPSSGTGAVPTVMFLPSGNGLRRNAQRMWDSYLKDGKDLGAFRIVIPYSVDYDFPDEFERTLDVRAEVLSCYGGDPRKVHIAGVSNGGHAAFTLMLRYPDRFATLLGAPGEFPTVRPADWAKPLAGKSVFNGVGEHDDDWRPGVRDTHDGLVSVGIDSTYVEFPGQGHIAGAGFDQNVLFDFWSKHSTK
jgi:predicted esterase